MSSSCVFVFVHMHCLNLGGREAVLDGLVPLECYAGLHIGVRGVGTFPPRGNFAPLDFCKVNTSYIQLLFPPTFWKLSLYPPSHTFCTQY